VRLLQRTTNQMTLPLLSHSQPSFCSLNTDLSQETFNSTLLQLAISILPWFPTPTIAILSQCCLSYLLPTDHYHTIQTLHIWYTTTPISSHAGDLSAPSLLWILSAYTSVTGTQDRVANLHTNTSLSITVPPSLRSLPSLGSSALQPLTLQDKVSNPGHNHITLSHKRRAPLDLSTYQQLSPIIHIAPYVEAGAFTETSRCGTLGAASRIGRRSRAMALLQIRHWSFFMDVST
jgi:hypothetical protein